MEAGALAANNEKKKILMVDDDEIHLSLAQNILMEKYEILTAKTGKEALDYFMNSNFPDLVLLDILMPNMDGWETYKRIRALSFLKDIPIAFLTSVTDTAEKERAREIGAVDFIAKPCEKKELLKRIRKILKNKKNV